MTEPFKWDWVVKATLWTSAILFMANFFVLEEGGQWHEWAGYLILISVIVRLIWGMLTASPARLSHVAPNPAKAVRHLMDVYLFRQDKHNGHNLAGAIMVWVLWSLLIATASSGWGMETDDFWGSDWLEEVHETLANLTMVAVAIHVAAVILMTKLTRKAYLRSMLP